METIAVYWESKIRVYGLSMQTGLSLYTVTFPVGRLAYWGGRIALLAEIGIEFQLVNLQALTAATMRLCLLLVRDGSEREISRLLEKGLASEDATTLQTVAPVELIYLHGPHFQDRYGIAEAAMAPVQEAHIAILAAGCSGTSVFLVVPENRAGMAATRLAETFAI